MELCEGEFLGGYFGIFNAGRLPNCWRTLRELIGWILCARGGQALLGRWVFGSLCLGLRSAQKLIGDTGTVIMETADSYFVYPSMGHAEATLP